MFGLVNNMHGVADAYEDRIADVARAAEMVKVFWFDMCRGLSEVGTPTTLGVAG